MDPKSAQTLDPKLKEAYDRVMGATVVTTDNVHTPPIHDPLDKMAAKETPRTPATPAVPTHQMTTPPPSPVQAATPSTHISSGFVAQHEQKKPAVSGTLLIVAGVIFLIVYTLFWLKWFGVALPFLP